MPVRLSPIIDPAADAILAGDPRRAFALAQAVIDQPKMSHLARGLWGYTGRTGRGRPLTVQSTGIGGPSAAAVVADLADLGVERIVRLGTCVATGPLPGAEASAAPGDPFLVTRSIPGDGTAGAITEGAAVADPDPKLNALLAHLAPPARISSHDLPARLDRSAPGNDPSPLRDMQTAATFAIAARFGIRAAAILVVVENETGERLDEPGLESAFLPLARSVAEALDGSPGR